MAVVAVAVATTTTDAVFASILLPLTAVRRTLDNNKGLGIAADDRGLRQLRLYSEISLMALSKTIDNLFRTLRPSLMG